MLKGFEVKQWIEGNYPQFVDKVFPAFTTVLDDLSIVYFTNTTSGGYVCQDTLELRVIHSDYDEAEVVKKNLIDIFSTEKKNTANVLPTVSFTGAVSGGGALYRDDLQMWEITTFFILNTKERA